MTNNETTIAEMIESLKSSIREIPADFAQSGCSSDNQRLREITSRRLVAWARGFANELDSMETSDAATLVAARYAEIVNVDPRGFYIGRLPHQIRMAAGAE